MLKQNYIAGVKYAMKVFGIKTAFDDQQNDSLENPMQPQAGPQAPAEQLAGIFQQMEEPPVPGEEIPKAKLDRETSWSGPTPLDDSAARMDGNFMGSGGAAGGVF